MTYGPEDLTGRADRPIGLASEDLLDRGNFVRRLTSALVNSESGSSSGITVGITGPWGSGKTSLLNLLYESIIAKYPNAIVVRFDPWIISGKTDLIAAFLNDLIAEIKINPKAFSKLKKTTADLAQYADYLSPAASILLPGAGAALSGAFKSVRSFLTQKESLNALREKLIVGLGKAEVPIIVLIDELDRVEDDEIRAVAQLVRAVADFPGISYVLAYDAERVAEALGAGSHGDKGAQRGRAYLEKIVQLQIPLPLTSSTETKNVVDAEMRRIAAQKLIPSDFESSSRYEELIELVSINVVTTPRDVTRIGGTFQVLVGLLGDEVDWVDLLAYSILLTKRPEIVNEIRKKPGVFTDSPINEWEIDIWMGMKELADQKKLEKLFGSNNLSWGEEKLIRFLFPDIMGEEEEYSHADALSNRRALVTTLRLGLPPGSFPKSDLRRILVADSETVERLLTDAFTGQRIDGLLERLNDMYVSEVDAAHVQFWSGVGRFLRKPDCEWIQTYDPRHSLVREFAAALQLCVRRDPVRFQPIAREVFQNLRGSSENELCSAWLRAHVHGFGLFGNQRRDDRGLFLDELTVEKICKDISIELRAEHMAGKLIPCRWSLQPIYSMIDTGIWDDECRGKLDEQLSDPLAVDGLTLMLFGSHFTSDREVLRVLLDIKKYLEAVELRLESAETEQLDKTVIVALRKALGKV